MEDELLINVLEDHAEDAWMEALAAAHADNFALQHFINVANYWTQRARQERNRQLAGYLERRQKRLEYKQRVAERDSKARGKMKNAVKWPGERPLKKCARSFWEADTLGPAAFSLVYAWILQNPDWLCTWVQPHLTLRWDKKTDHIVSMPIEGHYRRRRGAGKCPLNLALTCKFDRTWSKNHLIPAPAEARRQRKNDDGTIIPREQRQLELA